jgi:chromosome segregation ATPase
MTQKFAENASMWDALNAWKATAQQTLDRYQGLLDELRADVDGKVDQDDFDDAIDGINQQFLDLNVLIAGLQGDIANLQNDKADKVEVARLIADLQTQITTNKNLLQTLLDENLITRVADNEAAIATLQGAIADLQNQINLANQTNTAKFEDVLERLVKLETNVPLIAQKVEQALNLGQEAKDKAEAAQAAANKAQNAADLAQQTADAAKALAEKLEGKCDQLAKDAQDLANTVAGLADRLTKAEAAIEKNKEDIVALGNRITALESNYSILSKDVQEALQTARDAYAKAQINETEIKNLKDKVASLENKDTELDGKITTLNNTITELNNTITNLKSELEGKIQGNTTEITKLWAAIDALKLAGVDTQVTIQELSDRICCLETQVGLLEGSLAVATAASITHFEMAKKYADEQVHALEMRLTNYVQDYVATKLAEYLANHPDVDLSKYVTRDELNTRLQNYATQAELTTALSGINTRLGQLSNDMITADAALQTAINNLTKDVLQNGITINDLKNQLAALESRLNTLDGKYNTLDGKVNGINSQVTTNTADIAWIKALLTTLNGQVADLNANSSKYISRDEFNEWLKLMEEAIKNAGNHNNEGNTYDVDLALPSIVVQVIVKKIEDTLDDKVSEKLAELLSDKDFLDSFGKSLVDALGLLTADDLKALKYMTEDDVKALLEPIKALAEANQKDIEDHEDRITDLENKIKGLADLIVDDKVIDALKTIFATKDDIKDFLTEDQIKDLLDDYVPTNIINKYLTENDYITRTDATNIIQNLLKEYYTKEEINNKLDNYITNDYLTDNFYTKTEVLNLISTSEGKVKDLSDAVDDINNQLTDMKKDISDLKTDVKKNADAITELDKEVTKLKGDVKAIQEELAKQVTGIIIQGTYNPMFGTFNLPANIQSNILLSYYGLPKVGGEFPTYKTSTYTKAEQAFTSEEISTLKSQGLAPFEFFASEPLLNENGTGGKVYMTINPNTADLDGLQMSIVNTLDEEAPIRLRPIKKSEDKLQFGFTRANNGFYEAEAYIEPDDVTKDNGVPLTREEIENAFKSIRDRLKSVEDDYAAKGSTDLGQLATDVYQVIRGLKMDRHGLKCTYTANGAEHSVYSEYNMAATFFNPLNLNSAKDFNYKTMIGYETLDKILDDMAATLKDHVNVLFTNALNVPALQNLIRNFVIDELEFKTMSENYIAHFNARVSKINLNGADYKLHIPGSGTFAVMFDKNLTAGGSPVTIPAEVMYDESKVNAVRATIVIGGDINTGMTAMLVIPASGSDGVVNAYATASIYEESAKVTFDGSVIKVTTTDGTYTVAALTGSNIDATGYAPTVHMRDVVAGDGVLNLPVVLEISQDIQKLLEKQETTMERVVKSLNEYLNNINSYNGTVNGWVDSFIDDYLRKYLDQMNNSVVGFFNSINRRFGPFMAASNDSKGFKRLSGSKEYPTIMSKDNLKFYPTTKSLELLVPLARKHVAVTNVFKGTATAYDDADCLAKMKAVNSGADMNKVIDGTVRKVNVTGMEVGYVYEVAYSVLDFDGNMSTSRYYVTVK